MLGDDLLAQPLEGEPRHRLDEPVVALAEGAHQALVALGEARRQRVLEAGEERPPRRDAPQESERVVRDADERRGEHRQERRVVVAVLEQPQVHEQVDDLLLTEVALAGRAVRRQPHPPQLILVPLRVGAGREQQDDLARRRHARVHELAHAPGDGPRLSPPPVDAAVLVALLVGDEQLDRVAEDRVGELGRGGELLELPAEVRTEEVVDRGEHLGARAVVERQRKRSPGGLAPLAEHLDVGVAEAVDRLELVADEEELRLRRTQQVHDLGLQAVGVLELVDEDRAEARPLPVAELGLRAEQVARLELEILEVERRLAGLCLRVPGSEQRQQLLQERSVARRGLVERCLLDCGERLAVRGRAIAPGLEAAQRHQPVRPPVALQQLEETRSGLALGVGRVGLGRERGCSGPELLDPLGELRPRRHRQVELAPRRTQRLVDARQHPPQPVAPVGGEQLEPLRIVVGTELRERGSERLRPQHRRLRLVELAEARVEPGCQRIGPQEAGTEAVDRRDPRPVEAAREVVPAAVGEGCADPGPKLAGGAARVRDHEDRVDVEPAFGDRADDPLDEHRRLAGAGARGDEDLPSGLDRRELLLVQLVAAHAHGRSIRHIVQRSHHVGQSPPRGSWWTSPSWIRPASAVAVSRADSTTPQNASSSR